MKNLSEAEKTDVLLTLALAFEKRFAETDEARTAKTLSQIVEDSFSPIAPAKLENLRARAVLIEELPEEKRALWHDARFDKLRRRGKSGRLDENVNPALIVNILSREPRPIQILILQNLPAELSNRIALYLDLNYNEIAKKPAKPVNDEIAAHIRRTFLANFVALEDVFEPTELDKFSVAEITNFVRQISLREMAIACRGIASKETLAAFLNRFDEEDAREIALYLTGLEKIRPFWVAQADEIVRQTWRADLQPEKLLKKLGLKLLALAFIGRDDAAQSYTAQKLVTRDSRRWKKFVREYENRFQNAGEEEQTILEKRRKMLERLASKFIQTGKL